MPNLDEQIQQTLDALNARYDTGGESFYRSGMAMSAAAELIQRLKHQRDGYQWRMHECEQIAGKALGYPWCKDDQKNLPGATEADGVCVGEHVGDTIVAELAKRYEKTRNALENVVIAYGMGWDMDGVIGVAEEVLGVKK